MECMKLKRGPVLSGTLGNNARFAGLWGMVMPQGRRLLANHGKPLCMHYDVSCTHAYITVTGGISEALVATLCVAIPVKAPYIDYFLTAYSRHFKHSAHRRVFDAPECGGTPLLERSGCSGAAELCGNDTARGSLLAPGL